MSIAKIALPALGAASLLLAGCSLLPGNSTGGATSNPDTGSGGSVGVFTVQVGDCLNDPGVAGQITDVVQVDCAQPHNSEVYASIQMTDGQFPGEAAVKEQALADCTTEFTAFVGMEYTASALDFSYYYPTENTWANGDREILCLIVDPAGPVTGSLRGAAR